MRLQDGWPVFAPLRGLHSPVGAANGRRLLATYLMAVFARRCAVCTSAHTLALRAHMPYYLRREDVRGLRYPYRAEARESWPPTKLLLAAMSEGCGALKEAADLRFN